MKRYTFRIVIEEGSDEFWEQIEQAEASGCEEVKELLEEGLFAVGFGDCRLTLERFDNTDADV